MIRVKLITSFPDWPLIRQTPSATGRWDECQFFINDDTSECDALVVIDDVKRVEQVRCDPSRTLFINCEPPTIKSYPSNFLSQFRTVLTCGGHTFSHNNILQSQPALPWWLGVRQIRPHFPAPDGHRMNYDTFKSYEPAKKGHLLSVICSDSVRTPFHRRRLDFVKRLSKRMGDQIQVFGAAGTPIDDKLEALADFKYHIAIENSSYEDYWTEKLSDPYLAGTLPFYYGCPNIDKYFPESAFVRINLDDLDGCVQQIRRAIDEGLYENSVASLRQARELVLDTYNMFAVINRYVLATPQASEREEIIVKPASTWLPRQRTRIGFRTAIRRVANWIQG